MTPLHWRWITICHLFSMDVNLLNVTLLPATQTLRHHDTAHEALTSSHRTRQYDSLIGRPTPWLSPTSKIICRQLVTAISVQKDLMLDRFITCPYWDRHRGTITWHIFLYCLLHIALTFKYDWENYCLWHKDSSPFILSVNTKKHC